MKILVINGANLNMLGIREPEIYGKTTYKELVNFINKSAEELGVKVKTVQYNSEEKIIVTIQKAYKKYDGILINAGAFTHTSVAIADALRSVAIPTAEVHLTDITSREEYRKISFIGEYACVKVYGEGISGYKTALQKLISYLC